MGDSHFSVIVRNPILWVEYLDHLLYNSFTLFLGNIKLTITHNYPFNKNLAKLGVKLCLIKFVFAVNTPPHRWIVKL
jgi:hypothetical protein